LWCWIRRETENKNKGSQEEETRKQKAERVAMKVSLIGLVLLMFAVRSGNAQNGGGAGAFLLLAEDAGRIGMGGSSVAVPDHGSILTANPAGIAMLKGQGVGASYRFLSLNRRHSTISYTYGLASGAGFGLGWVSAGVGDIEGRDLNGQRTGIIDDNENAFLFAFSKGAGQRVAIGLTLTYLNQQLGKASAKGFGLDLGVIGKPSKMWVVGATAHNLRAKLSWQTPIEDRSSQTRDELPVRWVLGVAYMVKDALFSGEGEWTGDGETVFRTGVLLKVIPAFTVMAGIGWYTEEDGRISPTFGCAVRQPRNGDFELRYAYSNDTIDAGGGHVVTVIVGW
jgi:hypothetical protein